MKSTRQLEEYTLYVQQMWRRRPGVGVWTLRAGWYAVDWLAGCAEKRCVGSQRTCVAGRADVEDAMASDRPWMFLWRMANMAVPNHHAPFSR